MGSVSPSCHSAKLTAIMLDITGVDVQTQASSCFTDVDAYMLQLHQGNDGVFVEPCYRGLKLLRTFWYMPPFFNITLHR